MYLFIHVFIHLFIYVFMYVGITDSFRQEEGASLHSTGATLTVVCGVVARLPRQRRQH